MKKLILFLIFTFLIASHTNAQVSGYTFSQSQETFVPVLPYGQVASFFTSWDDDINPYPYQINFILKFAG